MVNVHTVFRKLGLPLGQVAIMPIKTFAEAKEASGHAQELNEAYARLMDCRVIDFSDPNAPRQTGLTVRDLLRDLGIHAFGNFVGQAPLHDGPEIVAPSSGIIMPGHH